MVNTLPGKSRFLIALPLGILAGILCTALASGSTPNIWGSALMWTIISNRFLIGLTVGLAGAYTRHPVFGFPFPPYVRGFCLGVWVSLTMAAGAMVDSKVGWDIFWLSLLAGGVYGLIIDMVATKWGKS